MRGRSIVTVLGLILLVLTCTAAFAQNPIQNPSFEDGMTGWTAYGYSEFWQVSAAAPATGGIGAGQAFTIGIPEQGAADGTQVCGFQGWYDAKGGGVYQTFTAPKAGYVIISARAFSFVVVSQNPYVFQDKDMGPRVHAAIVSGPATNRTAVPTSGANTWKDCAWGTSWNDIVFSVPSAGTYTLFIEDKITWDDCIYNVLWDNVRWADATVTMTNQPYVSNITETSATVQWDTDVAGTSVVNYDVDGPPYTSTASGASGTHHAVTLTGLTAGTNYQFSAATNAPPAQGASSPNANFTTAPSPVAQLQNGDFETGSLAPWQKFGKFDGAIANNTQATPARGGNFMAGAISSYSAEKSLAGCLQRVNVKPGASYVVRAWIWTENNDTYPPLETNRGAGWNTRCRVGIDPRGGVDLWYVDPATGQPIYDGYNQVFTDNPNIVWSDWEYSQDNASPYAQFGYQEIGTIVQIPADSNVATVFLQDHHMWALGLNRTIFDDVLFTEEIAVDNLSKAKLAPSNWVVDLSNNGQGYVVTRYELMNGDGGQLPNVWIQEDDRSSAMKVNLGNLPGSYEVSRGDRITLKGRTKKTSLSNVEWGETEITASEFTKVSSGNTEPKPVAMGNKAVAGSEFGTMRGATNGIGTNNVGLLIKTTGRVVSVDPKYMGYWFSYSIVISDGSGRNVRIYHPTDDTYFKDMPAVGEMVSAIGVCGLAVNDPTLNTEGMPNGSGDETLIPTVMLRDGRDLEVIPE